MKLPPFTKTVLHALLTLEWAPYRFDQDLAAKAIGKWAGRLSDKLGKRLVQKRVSEVRTDFQSAVFCSPVPLSKKNWRGLDDSLTLLKNQHGIKKLQLKCSDYGLKLDFLDACPNNRGELSFGVRMSLSKEFNHKFGTKLEHVAENMFRSEAPHLARKL